ncbi:DUF2156 domain-containing protein [Epibacterium sp. SM1979]|uniref:DUF2156 domain-containing protein n=1 Tax=Tritonibacter litoralis TaxID=2662264 RepID=A0A843YCV3_9RHOB|nr:GNAT family N-acetyltransferase [Tritonibacter litoralis]MQQ07314.1 DUF2156 domain-containing protein [Tritonibacter litoralis]
MLNFKPAVRAAASKVLRVTLPIASAVLCLWLLTRSIQLPSIGELTSLMSQIPILNWLGAAFATLVSFWSLGRYDSVAHRHLDTGLDGPRARLAGMAAIGFSQTAGFGIFTGTFARWRLLPGLSPVQAAQLTALTGLTFMAALAVICAVALVAWSPFPYAIPVGLFLMLGCGLACAATFVFPTLKIGQHVFRWPSFTAMSALTFWAIVDVTAAGAALWLLLPPDSGIALTTLLPAYFMALGLAIISSSPGGTGPLELTLVSLLSGYEAASVLAGLFAFRIVYYLVPVAISSIFLTRPALLGGTSPKPDMLDEIGARKEAAHRIPFGRPRSETAVIRQNGGHVQSFGLNQLALLDTPQISVAFFDPISGYAQETFAPLRHYARSRNAAACFYKCSPRVALAARKSGWRVLRIAADAIIDPISFSESGSDKRQLRRKLRHAEKSGIQVRPAAGTLPIAQLAQVDRNWHAAHGIAHGTTMGQFEAGYIQGQRVFLAWKNNTIIGFASFHVADQEWCLDLIRMGPDAPDGTGHAMIRAAIEAAKSEDVPRLSLAAVPDHRFAHRVERGLRRFKACFAPTWQPLYIAAPNWGHLTLSLAELIRLVHRPLPVQPAAEWQPADLAPEHDSDAAATIGKTGGDIHNKDEENEIVFMRRA